MNATILSGDVIEQLRTLLDNSVQCVVTSPPYYGLRDYGTAKWEGGDPACDHSYQKGGRNPETSAKQLSNAGTTFSQYEHTCAKCGARRIDNQIGLEPTPAAYVARMVEVFREVRRVLRDDGTCWLNLGDSYNGSGGPTTTTNFGKQADGFSSCFTCQPRNVGTLKPKDLVGIPWRVAFALQEDGWWLRSDIIWAKPNPMPESVTDRPTKAHEYVFLLTKSARYYYDAEAIKEDGIGHVGNRREFRGGGAYTNGNSFDNSAAKINRTPGNDGNPAGRNARTVWTIATQPFSGVKLMTDYVGRDGKPYTASPDCPIHGRHSRSHKSYTPEGDVQLTENQNRNLDNDGDRVPSPAPLLDAMTSHNSPDVDGENVQRQTTESNHDCKSATDRHESTFGARTADRTSRMSESHGEPDCKTDSLDLLCSAPANDRNTQTSRTDHVRLTSPHDTACAETPDRTPNTSRSDAHTDSDDRIDESSNEVDCAADVPLIGPSEQTTYRNAHKYTQPLPTSESDYTCTCKITQVDHFATFPKELPRRCILAGSKGGDTVLDPFLGSGTTIAVALELGRHAIGIELNPEYVKLAERRLAGVTPALFGV